VNLFLQRAHSVLLEFMTESEEHWQVTCERTKFDKARQLKQEEREQYSQPVEQPDYNRTNAFVIGKSEFILTLHAILPSGIAGFTISNRGVARSIKRKASKLGCRVVVHLIIARKAS
jgi:hypothetical protein